MDKTQAAANTQVLLDFKLQTVYLMGGSFILGSLITVLMLLALDFIRRNKTNDAQ